MSLETLYRRQNTDTAFGELLVAELTPIVHLSYPYNINTNIVEERSNGGSASVSGGLLTVSTGAGANQSSMVLSKIPLKYNAGTGALFRGTAVFTTGVANSHQQIGVGGHFDGFFFGYQAANFGLKRVHGGAPEIRTLTVTTGSSHSENITITLDSVAKTDVAVTNTGDVTLTANEIAAADYSAVGIGWNAHAEGATVIFVSWEDTARTGTYTLSSATSAVGTFAQTVAGTTVTEVVTAQTAWNVDKMDGTGPSGQTLDPTKGNVYQIRYQWLGFGMISFSVEIEDTGELQLVHQIKYANANTVPSIQNPTLPIVVMVHNAANTSDLTISTSSMAGFVEGEDGGLGPLTGTSATNLSVGTTELPLFTIHNKNVFQSKINRAALKIVIFSASTDATNTVKIRILIDATLTGASFSDHSTNTSIVATDTTATAVSGGIELFHFSMGKSDTQIVDVSNFDMNLYPGQTMTMTAEAAAGTTSDVTLAANWIELI